MSIYSILYELLVQQHLESTNFYTSRFRSRLHLFRRKPAIHYILNTKKNKKNKSIYASERFIYPKVSQVRHEKRKEVLQRFLDLV